MEDKRRSWFWPLQIAVWLIIGLLNYLVQAAMLPGISMLVLSLNFLGTTGGGFIITTLYRYYLKRNGLKFTLSVGVFVGRLLLTTIILYLLWMALNVVISLSFFGSWQVHLAQLMLANIPLLILLLVWNLFYLGFQLITQYHISEVEKWKLQAEVQKAQLGNLKAQINPHFIFNALNNIRAMILEDHQQARLMLTKFSEILRYALKHAEDIEITMEKEIEMLQQYLDLVKIQYEDRLVFSITAEPALLTEKIPPMILQLLAENAIKHGISLSSTGGEIHISIEDQVKYILLTVKNTGTLKQGSQLEESLGVGLKNVTERLSLIYGNKAVLTMEEKAPDVIVVIKIEK